jgi:adenine/guanine phosphoribosyltransferase-like PRPP-binding protein
VLYYYLYVRAFVAIFMTGAKDKAMEMAKKLKEKGIDIVVIAETSGLTAAEIAML